MDKIDGHFTIVKQRKGFALLVTLSVLTVIMALTTVLLGYLDKTREDASTTKAFIQANIYYTDITKIFNTLEEKKALFSTLYFAPLPLRSDEGRFSMSLHCKPLSRGINVNWLGEDSNPERTESYVVAQTVFDLIVEQYNLQDPSLLQEMLLEEIHGGERYTGKAYSRLLQKNGIISYLQFTDIVSRYQREVDDKEVSRIPWDKYFSFSVTAKVLDAEYSSPELISLLFDINIETVTEWYNDFDKSNLATFVKMNGGDYAKRKEILAGETFLEESMCTVSYEIVEQPYRFSFEYVQGEAKYFEFYGKQ